MLHNDRLKMDVFKLCTNTDNMDNFVDLSSGLSSDYEKLYKNGKYTDISIHVGREPNTKIFLAHTLVLCARSTFLENSLAGNTEASEEIQKAALTFEDMTPDVFEILLRYIYTGRLSYNACKNVGWISLLDGVSKFELFDLLTGIETCLIDKQEDWIQQNILTVHKYAASTVTLNKLLAYCNRIMVSHPDIIFKSNDLAKVPKETLITLLKSDELSIDEDDIWVSVIQWATKQVPGLELGNDSDAWSSNDINTVKDIIADCIPHIRFFNISPNKVAQYYDLLPKKLCRDLFNYNMDKSYKPNTHVLPPRMGQGCQTKTDSVIVDEKQAEWISSKIVESTRQLQKKQRASGKHCIHRFTLLYRKSRDGNLTAKFRELCNNKGPTVAVGKVLNTGEILGGYNPLSWGSRSKSGHADTKESFIFALDKSMDKSIVSFVNDSTHAIYDIDNSRFPAFGDGGYDLYFGGRNMPIAQKSTYQVPIRNSTNRFEWVDWEVLAVQLTLI